MQPRQQQASQPCCLRPVQQFQGAQGQLAGAASAQRTVTAARLPSRTLCQLAASGQQSKPSQNQPCHLSHSTEPSTLLAHTKAGAAELL